MALDYPRVQVLIRKLEPPDLSLFFGFLGVTTFLLFGPLIALLHVTAVEDVSALTLTVFGLIVLKVGRLLMATCLQLLASDGH